MRQFGVVIAGGGTAGCVLAARLSEDPERRVCLVEAGPDYGPYDDGRWPADLLDGRAVALSHSWETDREDRSQLRARVIGGCSAHNACAVIAGTEADYDEWGPDGRTRARPVPRAGGARAADAKVPAGGSSPWHRAFAEAAARAPSCIPRTRSAQSAGTPPSPTSTRRASRPNLTILAETLADRVDPDPRVLHTDRGELAADTIVLAAGAYGSPGILLRSGIGPGLEHDLPVGEGLVDHVGAGVAWEPTAALQEEATQFAEAYPAFMAQVTVRFGRRHLPLPLARARVGDRGARIRDETVVARLRAAALLGPPRAAGDRAWVPLRFARPRHGRRGDRGDQAGRGAASPSDRISRARSGRGPR